MSNGEYDLAIADFSQAIALEPDNALAYFDRGIAYGSKGDYDLAIADFGQAIALNPDLSIADSGQSITLNPDAADTYYTRGRNHASEERYALAIACYNQAILLNPNDGSAYNARGQAYRELGNVAQADANEERAAELNPELRNRQ